MKENQVIERKNKFSPLSRRFLLMSVSLLLLFLFTWLGLSFLSMQSDNPYVDMYINLQKENIARKVPFNAPQKDSKYLIYSIPITFEQVVTEDNKFKLSGVPTDFESRYSDREAARFEFELQKKSGSFDFTTLSWDDPINIALKYRIDQDFRYFKDFSICSLMRFGSKILGLNNTYSNGYCLVERDILEWSITPGNPVNISNGEFLSSIDRDSIVKKLLNFYITNDSGYFLLDGIFKVKTTQEYKDGYVPTFKSFASSMDMIETSYPFWLVNGVLDIYSKKYEEYTEIDIFQYVNSVLNNIPSEPQMRLGDCFTAYEIVSKLPQCSTTDCSTPQDSAIKSIRDISYQHCKKVLESTLFNFDIYEGQFKKYSTKEDGNDYILSLASEMIYYNKILKILELQETQYSEKEIQTFSDIAKELETKSGSTVRKCYLLKNYEEMFNEYKVNKYSSLADTIYSTLPDFSKICNTRIKDEYCLSDISKRLVCADALSYRYKEISETILYDIYYRHYSDSIVSPNMYIYESSRNILSNRNLKGTSVKLDEYSYFSSQSYTKFESNGPTVYTVANMLDSYYFINILNKLKQ